MGIQLSPSVKVNEIDLSIMVPALGASIACFAGEFTKGPSEVFLTITNVEELIQFYGKPTNYNYNDWFQCYNFLQLANKLLISRAVNSFGSFEDSGCGVDSHSVPASTIYLSLCCSAEKPFDPGVLIKFGENRDKAYVLKDFTPEVTAKPFQAKVVINSTVGGNTMNAVVAGNEYKIILYGSTVNALDGSTILDTSTHYEVSYTAIPDDLLVVYPQFNGIYTDTNGLQQTVSVPETGVIATTALQYVFKDVGATSTTYKFNVDAPIATSPTPTPTSLQDAFKDLKLECTIGLVDHSIHATECVFVLENTATATYDKVDYNSETGLYTTVAPTVSYTFTNGVWNDSTLVTPTNVICVESTPNATTSRHDLYMENYVAATSTAAASVVPQPFDVTNVFYKFDGTTKNYFESDTLVVMEVNSGAYEVDKGIGDGEMLDVLSGSVSDGATPAQAAENVAKKLRQAFADESLLSNPTTFQQGVLYSTFFNPAALLLEEPTVVGNAIIILMHDAGDHLKYIDKLEVTVNNSPATGYGFIATDGNSSSSCGLVFDEMDFEKIIVDEEPYSNPIWVGKQAKNAIIEIGGKEEKTLDANNNLYFPAIATPDLAKQLANQSLVPNDEYFELNKDSMPILGALKFIARYSGEEANGLQIAIANKVDFEENRHVFGGILINNLFDVSPKDTEIALVFRKEGLIVERYIVSLTPDTKDWRNKSIYIEDVINKYSEYVFVLHNREAAFVDSCIYTDEALVPTSGTTANPLIINATLNPGSNTQKVVSYSNPLTKDFISYDSNGDTYTVNTFVLTSNGNEKHTATTYSLGFDGCLVLDNGYDGFVKDGDIERALGSVSEETIFGSKETIDIDIVIANERVRVACGKLASDRADCIAFMGPKFETVVGLSSTVAIENMRSEVIDGELNSASTNNSFCAYFGNYTQIYDKYNDKTRWISIAGQVAALRAKTNDDQNTWWASAGLDRGSVKNVLKVAFNPSQGQRDILYKNKINPIVAMPGLGNCVVWGQKTLSSKPSSFDRINVRGLFNSLERAIARMAKYYLFEFNDSFTRNRFIGTIRPFLETVKAGRGIFDYAIRCDEHNNTPYVIDSNQFVADIAVKPTRVAEFITLNFFAVGTGVSFSEVFA